MQQETGLAHRPLRDAGRRHGFQPSAMAAGGGTAAWAAGIGHRAGSIGHMGTGAAAWAVSPALGGHGPRPGLDRGRGKCLAVARYQHPNNQWPNLEPMGSAVQFATSELQTLD